MTKILKVIGLMSGTSLDGVDAAFLETDGETIFAIGKTHFRPYSAQEKTVLNAVTQEAIKWGFNGEKPESFAKAEAIIDNAHIETVQSLGIKDVDLIGYHGQTILHHAPNGNVCGQTLQLGSGQALADALGIDVAYDFRSADVAAGGQGAPLAPIYHKALASYSRLDLPIGILNIGGVSNITIITKDTANGCRLLASDCGPGNGPLDSWVQQCGLGDYDDGGKIGREGNPDFSLIDTWLERDFFMKPMPKSADRWDFDVLADLKNRSPEDGAASLTLFTVKAIAKTIEQYAEPLEKIIICGGGRHNLYMTWLLAGHTDARVVSAESVGWNGDDLEAQAFAYLAVRTLRGLPLSFPKTTGIAQPLCGGKIVKPNLQTQ